MKNAGIACVILAAAIFSSLAALTSAAAQKLAIVEMDVQPGGVVILDHQKTSVRTDFGRRLQEIARRVPRPILLLKASPALRYDEAAKVMSMAYEVGLEIDLGEVPKARRVPTLEDR